MKRRLTSLVGLASLIALLALPAAAAPGIAVYQGPYAYKHITAGATTVVVHGGGQLHTICDNLPVNSSTITVYDNTAASGAVVGIITNLATAGGPYCMEYDVIVSTGLTIVTSGADDVTVAYQGHP